MEIKIGVTVFPKPRELKISANCVTGPFWKAERVGTQVVLEFLASRHGGGTDRHEISEADFLALKEGQITGEDLIRKYDL